MTAGFECVLYICWKMRAKRRRCWRSPPPPLAYSPLQALPSPRALQQKLIHVVAGLTHRQNPCGPPVTMASLAQLLAVHKATTSPGKLVRYIRTVKTLKIQDQLQLTPKVSIWLQRLMYHLMLSGNSVSKVPSVLSRSGPRGPVDSIVSTEWEANVLGAWRRVTSRGMTRTNGLCYMG